MLAKARCTAGKFCRLYRENAPFAELSVPVVPIKPVVSGFPIVLVVVNGCVKPIIPWSRQVIANQQVRKYLIHTGGIVSVPNETTDAIAILRWRFFDEVA